MRISRGTARRNIGRRTSRVNRQAVVSGAAGVATALVFLAVLVAARATPPSNGSAQARPSISAPSQTSSRSAVPLTSIQRLSSRRDTCVWPLRDSTSAIAKVAPGNASSDHPGGCHHCAEPDHRHHRPEGALPDNRGDHCRVDTGPDGHGNTKHDRCGGGADDGLQTPPG